MSIKTSTGLLALVIAAGLATPAAAADKETRQMMADIRILEQSQQLQNLIRNPDDHLERSGQDGQRPARRTDQRQSQGAGRPEGDHRRDGE
jgi:hypothetical protein